VIFVLLPAYNEEQGIRQVLTRIKQIAEATKEPFRVIVVDDGSADKTSEYPRSFSDQLDLKLIVFPENRGVAEVFRIGFRYICDESADPANDICIVLDSDNTQDPRVMVDLIKKIREGDDLVIASRFKSPGRMVGCSLMRHLYSVGLSILMQLIVGLPGVKDYSMFYRAYRVSLLKKGFSRYEDRLVEGKGFSVMGGCLIKLSNLTNRISEVPLTLRYGKKRGASGINVLKTIRGYMELIRECVRTDRFRKIEL